MASDQDTGVRKLAAIMFTDIKNFSKKMGEDEVAGLQVLRVHDAMMKEVVERHGGIVIKSIGDSFMVDFSSAVNAVKCAIDAQESFWNYNKEKSEFEKIEIRVGIHLGDVVTIGNDIFGDGVNIAARIEAITEPSRICISEDVYKQVKKKMQIRVYDIGAIELKNIAEPVEVYEILLDSIPDLSEPSQSARQAPTRKKADAISKQEEEEAKLVEAAKKAGEEKQKEEQERQTKADEILKRAEEAFREGNLEKADEEIKEIYKIVSVHYGAQMLLLQIEEERSKREEEGRRQRLREEKKRKEEERHRKIQDCLQRAMQFVEQDRFADAVAVVKEVYMIDPKNAEAKQLEEQIKQAEQAKVELVRLQALEAEQKAQEEIERQRREAEEALRQAKLAAGQKARTQQSAAKKSKLGLYAGIGAGVLVVAALAVYLLLPGVFSSGPPAVAVLAFEYGQLVGEDNYKGAAVAQLIAENLARATQLTVTAPSSATRLESKGVNLAQAGSAFGTSHVVLGTYQETHGVSISVKLIKVEDQQTIWESTFQGTSVGLNDLAIKAAGGILTALNIEAPGLPAQRFTSNEWSYDLYIRGQHLIQQQNDAAIDSGVVCLKTALQGDSVFAQAYAALGKGILEQYKRGGERDRSLLGEAFNMSRAAITLHQGIAQTYTVIAEINRYLQRFDGAREAANKGLSLQAGSADGHRQLAWLSIIEGDYEKASQYVTTVVRLDPRHPESFLVKGLLHHFKREYDQAAAAYDLATNFGAPDSLTSVRYKFSAWVSVHTQEDLEAKIVRFCEKYLQGADDRTKAKLYYWIARANNFRGKSMESLAELDKGIAAADKALTANPNDVESIAYLALLQSRRGRVDAAKKEMERAETIAPESVDLTYFTARMFAVQQDKKSCLEALAKAVALEFRAYEILDSDFLSIATDPEFVATIARKPPAQSSQSE